MPDNNSFALLPAIEDNLWQLVLQVVLSQVGKDLDAACLLGEEVIVPFGAFLVEGLAKGVAVWTFSSQDPTLVDHVDRGALWVQEDRISTLTVPSVVTQLSFRVASL